jgi:hypothetical protein
MEYRKAVTEEKITQRRRVRRRAQRKNGEERGSRG